MTADRLAVCQHPDGEELHVPLKLGEGVDTCFQQCDCTPRTYIAADVVVEWLRGRGSDMGFEVEKFCRDFAVSPSSTKDGPS